MTPKPNESFVRNESGWLDMTGAIASWLCAVHCLLLPFLITLLPIAGLTFLLDESMERILIGVSVVLAALSLIPGYLKFHKKLRTILFAFSGISLIAVTHIQFEENILIKTILLVMGAVLISTGHIINRRLCRDCLTCVTDGKS
jgi:hypothetical protein